MGTPNKGTNDLPFLNGGGKMGQVMRSFDWATSPLGPANKWPPTLKQAVSMLLTSPLPVLICWGKTLIPLYNDQFCPIASGYHEDFICGSPIQIDSQQWDDLRAALSKVLEGENLILPKVKVPTKSKAESYYDFCCNPLIDETGAVKGIFVVCIEATSRINAQRSNVNMARANVELAAANDALHSINRNYAISQNALEASLEVVANREQEILTLINSAPFPIAVYVGLEMKIIQANQSIIDVWGKGPDVIGKTYFDILPELESQQIYEKLIKVYETGIAFHGRNQRVDLMVHGELKEFYFNYSFTPLRDKTGKVYGVMNTAADVTDLYLSKQRIEYSERNFRNMIIQAPVAMCLFKGSEFVIENVNQPMLNIWGKTQKEVLDKPAGEVFPEGSEHNFKKIMDEVYQTGHPFFAYERPITIKRQGKTDTLFQNFVYQPYRNQDGQISGILAISVNVTEEVKGRIELQKAYEQIRLSKKAAKLGTFDIDLINNTIECDSRCRELFGVQHQNEVTYKRDFLGRIHPDDRPRVILAIEQLFDKQHSNGDYDIEHRTIDAKTQEVRWIMSKGKLYFDGRFIGSVMDITAQKLNEIRLAAYAEKQAHLAALINSSGDIIISKTLAGTITSWNPAAECAFGYTKEEAVGKHISIIIPTDKLTEEDYIISEIRAGRRVDHFETVRIGKTGNKIPLSITVSPIIDEDGKIIGASKIARDISTQIESQQLAKQYTDRLEIMNMIISTISEELDMNKILQKVTDATTNLTGAKFGAFFYNTLDENGESYMLYTLSGASRDAFEKFGMPRNTAVFHPTFSGEAIVRVDDITKDPRYGKNPPHYGMPKGHLPVTSYLAVPVVSRSGTVIGGLFFGHPEPGRFTLEHETLVASIAAQAAIGIDNAKLFEEVKTLNDKKDEFIGLASHELKTPLASINGYVQILQRLTKDGSQQKFLDKASRQISRLTTLVNDLLDVSKIEAGKLRLTISSFDLKQVIDDAIDLISHESLKYEIVFRTRVKECMVYGDSQRIEQVIINLLSNAIKYAPAANRVEVELKCSPKKVVVSVTDFGLGIPADRLKNIFTRFYRVDDASPNISGLGIGLYLAHEMINRHSGKIWVESTPGKGSTFFFSLPFKGKSKKLQIS